MADDRDIGDIRAECPQQARRIERCGDERGGTGVLLDVRARAQVRLDGAPDRIPVDIDVAAQREPRPTIRLTMQCDAGGSGARFDRQAVQHRRELLREPRIRLGVLQMRPDDPTHNRSLSIEHSRARRLWSAVRT